MVRSGVLLLDGKFGEAGFEIVAAASVAGEPGRVDESVVGQD